MVKARVRVRVMVKVECTYINRGVSVHSVRVMIRNYDIFALR